MSLTEQQELEMYADIKVIKQNCLNCKECQVDHERRIKFLERAYWILAGVCTIGIWLLERFLA